MSIFNYFKKKKDKKTNFPFSDTNTNIVIRNKWTIAFVEMNGEGKPINIIVPEESTSRNRGTE